MEISRMQYKIQTILFPYQWLGKGIALVPSKFELQKLVKIKNATAYFDIFLLP